MKTLYIIMGLVSMVFPLAIFGFLFIWWLEVVITEHHYRVLHQERYASELRKEEIEANREENDRILAILEGRAK